MADRRSHNFGQIVKWLDKDYPDTAPGSPDPDQPYDDNKKGSRVVAKSGAQKRIDSALGGKRPDKKGREVVVDREIARSYSLLSRLFETVPAGISDAHRLAARFVLLNVNTAGGMAELERIEDLGRGDPAAKEVARLCRKVVRGVLDELDAMGYWLGWGTDADEAERQAAAADRRKKAAVLATSEGETGVQVIAAYRELMLKTGGTVEEAEDATMEHFGCGRWKVQQADRKARGVA